MSHFFVQFSLVQKRLSRKYKYYDRLYLAGSGKISKLLAFELDKYLKKHNLYMKCNKKNDKIKAITTSVLKSERADKQKHAIVQNREEIDIVDDRDEESDNSDNKDSDDEDIISKNLDESSTSEEFDPYEEAPLVVATI